MSENVLSYGVMAALVQPVGDLHTAEWAEFQERIAKYGLDINYEGTLIYSDKSAEFGEMMFTNSDDFDEFFDDLKMLEINVIFESSKIYATSWYNGADSSMSECTLEQFNKEF